MTQLEKLRTELRGLGTLHFIGIGGSGMSPLAAIVLQAGGEVSGSDSVLLNAESLGLAGVQINQGHDDLRLLQTANTIVYSSATASANKEFDAANALGKRLMHRSELLACISLHFKTITVSGTHGKSTTSALIAHLMTKGGLDPSYVLGAKLMVSNGVGTAFRLGNGPYLVIESDESDGSFERYAPFIGVVTNIDADHLDYYGSLDKLQDAFLRHLQRCSPEGAAVVFWDNERVRQVSSQLRPLSITGYGSFLGSNVRLLEVKQTGPSAKIDAMFESVRLTYSLPMMGRHNAFNSLAALSVLKSLGKDPGQVCGFFKDFLGVQRRSQCYYSSPLLDIYDDYAHNPAKISNCIAGFRLAYPDSYIDVVFQAHRYSRLSNLFDETFSSFNEADRVVVVPIYSAGESEPSPKSIKTRLQVDTAANPFSSVFQSKAISQLSKVPSIFCESLKEAAELLQSNIPQRHRVVLTLGAGDVWHVARDLTKMQ